MPRTRRGVNGIYVGARRPAGRRASLGLCGGPEAFQFGHAFG